MVWRHVVLGCVLLCVALTDGCGPHPPLREVFPPSDERIRELARARTRHEIRESPFEVKVMPAVALAGSAVWVTCYVPLSMHTPDNEITYGLAGHFQSGPVRVQRIENRQLAEHLTCGTFAAFCVVKSRQTGHEQRREFPLTVKGICNSENG